MKRTRYTAKFKFELVELMIENDIQPLMFSPFIGICMLTLNFGSQTKRGYEELMMTAKRCKPK